MFQKGDHMVVLAALIIFAVVGGIFVNYLRRNQNDIGGGMGKDYMIEHSGYDDDMKSKKPCNTFCVPEYFIQPS